MHSLFQNIGSSLPLGGEGLSVGGQAFSDGTVEHLLGQEGTSIKRRAFPNNRMAFASLSGSGWPPDLEPMASFSMNFIAVFALPLEL
jgi:hypothetical protein